MDQSVSRAVALLEALSRSGAPMRLSRLAEATGLQKSTAHRLLRSWIALGYVEQEPETSHYRASLRTWELGSAVVMHHPVKRAASGFLQALHKDTGETVSLLVADGDDVVYLDKLFSPRSARFSTRPGSRVPAPLTAGGKAILATDPDAPARLERTAARLGPAPPFSVQAVLEELNEVRARGYSMSSAQAGAVSFGCAVATRPARAPAAISISAAAERMSPDVQDRLVEALMATCASLAETLGPL